MRAELELQHCSSYRPFTRISCYTSMSPSMRQSKPVFAYADTLAATTCRSLMQLRETTSRRNPRASALASSWLILAKRIQFRFSALIRSLALTVAMMSPVNSG